MENKSQSIYKIEKVEEKKLEGNPKSNDNKFKYIYFIITYNKLKQLKVYLSPEYKGSDSLEKINEILIDTEKGFLSSDIYRFKIIEQSFDLDKDQKDYQIPVNVENENKINQ